MLYVLTNRATHQLRLQDAILQLLFAVLYQNPSRPALVSEALVRGSIISAFGTQQANTEFWENSSECARLEIRIRDLLILITCESLCLGSALSDETDKDVEASLIGDKNRLASLNDFVQSQSLDLDIQGATLDGQEALRASDWPIAVICLAWAIVLRETPEDVRPTGDEEDACFIMTRRALAGTSGLFDWLERLLSGPLLEPKREDVGGGIVSNLLVTRKKVIKGTSYFYEARGKLTVCRSLDRPIATCAARLYPRSACPLSSVGEAVWRSRSVIITGARHRLLELRFRLSASASHS